MAGKNALMRPLGPDSLKPRPSTQAVWEPRRPAQQAEPAPGPEPTDEPAEKEVPVWEDAEEAAMEEEPAFPPCAENVFTFAPASSVQPEVMEEEDEEPFDLDAVIASILAEDDDEDDEEDHSAAQDAVPTGEMPAPATVPLYDAPRSRGRRKGWIWLIAAAAAAAAGYAVWRCGWLR